MITMISSQKLGVRKHMQHSVWVLHTCSFAYLHIFSFSLTLIDSLDTLVVLGDVKEFEKGVKLVIETVSFDKDFAVSVFETNIRVVG